MKALIIIPAFNEAEAIGKVVSITKKTLKFAPINARILVIDDGPTDNTAKIAHG